jgi:tetratricopeptide (TPR) repeat protein
MQEAAPFAVGLVGVGVEAEPGEGVAMLLTREQARLLDPRAMEEFAVPGIVLMENAGHGMAELLRSLGLAGPVVICCGKGNNGGGGFVIARHLDNAGVNVCLLLFTKAAGTGKELALVYGLEGRLALGLRRLCERLAAAEKAVSLSPCEASGWYVRGRVRLEREAPGALSDLQKVAELSKRRDADVLRALAEAQMQAGQAEPARQTLQEAIKLRPGDKRLAELLKAWQGRATPQR